MNMSSNSVKTGPPSRLAQGSYPTSAPTNQSLLLEKVNARTSTPDSEALASSEDEGEHRQETSQPPPPASRPVRRPSWLNDISQPLARPRKGSFASSSMSPTTSHPSTPSAELGAAAAWGPHPSHSSTSIINRAPVSTAFGWGTGIWNTDRKDPSLRFAEVVPSPTSTVPPHSMSTTSFFGPDSFLPQTTSASREGTTSQIPFAIPLHPTPKTYRSQSYSAGQLDPEISPGSGMSSSTLMGRGRHPALQHRPSRPSMLSEMSNDGSMLGKVKEVEDDDAESASESLQGSFHQSAESKTIEMLTRENAMLRQQQQQQQQQQYNSRIRPRTSTGSTFVGNGYPLREYVPGEPDYAIDELDETNDGDATARRAASRRMSEFGSGLFGSPFGLESKKVEPPSLKKTLWSTSPALFAGDASQSRRHSFANMPTRQGSISSVAESVSTLEAPTPTGDGPASQAFSSSFADNQAFSAGNSSTFFPSASNMATSLQPMYNNPYMSQFGMLPQFSNRPSSPHRNVYSIAPPRHNQLLHIVLFKCARADAFYIQEGTGLTVKPGDLVIVEADRGTDLGTVAKDNVDWQTAKELKEHYAEEQYKWLMMYSQNAAAAQEGSGPSMLASNGVQGSAVGGMGPANQHHMQESGSGELRPKLIKRLAQNHEVHALRDKEGQEAKAKRVCMQKVKEHGLNMEILDAEFQMDWKKLTFYYFADSYINFNSLVTDLFKIYKTRIWMSAINPASFASPTLGIQAPSGVGPGAVGVGRGSSGSERRQNPASQQQQQQQQPPPPQSQQQQQQQQQSQEQQQPSQGFSAVAQSRGLRLGFSQAPPTSGYPPTNYGYGPSGVFGNARMNGSFAGSMAPGIEGFHGAAFGSPGDFQPMRQRFPGQTLAPATPHSQVSPLSSQSDWTSSFQGLSLNTH